MTRNVVFTTRRWRKDQCQYLYFNQFFNAEYNTIYGWMFIFHIQSIQLNCLKRFNYSNQFWFYRMLKYWDLLHYRTKRELRTEHSGLLWAGRRRLTHLNHCPPGAYRRGVAERNTEPSCWEISTLSWVSGHYFYFLKNIAWPNNPVNQWKVGNSLLDNLQYFLPSYRVSLKKGGLVFQPRFRGF